MNMNACAPSDSGFVASALALDDRLTVGQPHGVRSSASRLYVKWIRWALVVKGEPLLKRALDVCGALLVALVAAPVIAVVGFLVRCTDGGPMLFWQKRVGRDGRVFDFPKLRSMRVGAEAALPALAAQNQHARGITFKIKVDPRVTWIGRVMRRWSIDELPQLWCVLTGDMSLVGPRPALPSEVARYSPDERRRLDAIPGLTCLWQINGRADVPFERQVLLDVAYIEESSVGMDLRILALTVPAVLTGRGAY